ncbi:hypothetical protein ACFLVS_02655 [Chloroflexota bacterium]
MKTLMLFVIFAVVCTFLEWAYGALWNLGAKAPWIYSDSPWLFTSWKVIPLWGFGGLFVCEVYKTVKEHELMRLLWSALWLGLGALYVVIMAFGVE